MPESFLQNPRGSVLHLTSWSSSGASEKVWRWTLSQAKSTKREANVWPQLLYPVWHQWYTKAQFLCWYDLANNRHFSQAQHLVNTKLICLVLGRTTLFKWVHLTSSGLYQRTEIEEQSKQILHICISATCKPGIAFTAGAACVHTVCPTQWMGKQEWGKKAEALKYRIHLFTRHVWMGLHAQMHRHRIQPSTNACWCYIKG